MAAPKTVVWTLDPHTRAKHEILRRYLEAWTAILGYSGFPTIAYVDGFAGPGIYEGGEDGSPVIALKAALQHAANLRAKLLFLFVERDLERATRLEQVVTAMNLPASFHWKVIPGKSFEDGVRAGLLDFYRSRGQPLPPTFAFIDPFGWAGVPFDLVREILSQPRCEVLVNFMFEEINRFIGHRGQTANFDALFGTPDWRQMDAIVDPQARKRFLHGLYFRQLREVAGAKYVRSFEMRNEKDVTDYFLFFATKSAKGIQKMKEAMWKVDQLGEFRFSDATNPAQATLFGQPDFNALSREIVDKFAGTTTTVGEVEDFVLAETAFHASHYKRQVLAVLEKQMPPRLVAISPPPGRRAGTFSDPAMRIQFPR